MFAIIETGGKQYTVTPSQTLQIEKIKGKAGDKVSFDKVLLVAEGNKIQIGKPYVKGAAVSANILTEGKGKKIEGLKYKAKSRYRRSYGHRQQFMEVRIEAIKA